VLQAAKRPLAPQRAAQPLGLRLASRPKRLQLSIASRRDCHAAASGLKRAALGSRLVREDRQLGIRRRAGAAARAACTTRRRGGGECGWNRVVPKPCSAGRLTLCIRLNPYTSLMWGRGMWLGTGRSGRGEGARGYGHARVARWGVVTAVSRAWLERCRPGAVWRCPAIHGCSAATQTQALVERPIAGCCLRAWQPLSCAHPPCGAWPA
jgi:hypothetical protein